MARGRNPADILNNASTVPTTDATAPASAQNPADEPSAPEPIQTSRSTPAAPQHDDQLQQPTRGSVVPPKQPARTATIGIRVPQSVADEYEQFCRTTAAEYGVPQKIVTAHVAEHLMAALPQVRADVAAWAAGT